jgi:hypothetical protein
MTEHAASNARPDSPGGDAGVESVQSLTLQRMVAGIERKGLGEEALVRLYVYQVQRYLPLARTKH